MVEKISVQIALTGTEEIKRQLAGVSQAGQKAFEDISAAAAKAGGFDRLDPTLVAQKFSQFGITATTEINKINAALKSATKLETTVAGVAELERGFDRAAAGAQRATAAFGLTRREIGAIRTGLRQLDLGGIGGQFAALGRVGAAFGPVGIALAGIGAAAAVATKLTIGFAESISKVSTEALKLRIPIEQFDGLRLGLEKAGLPAEAITSGIAGLKEELDKLNVKQTVADLESLNKRGFALTGLSGARDELKKLVEMATKLGPAGDLARQSLEKLGLTDLKKLTDEALQTGAAGERARRQLEQMGLPISLDPVIAAFRKLGIEAGTIQQRLPEIVEKLRLMPDSAERTELAITLLGQSLGIGLIQALRTGSVAVDQFKQKLDQAITQDKANQADALTQAINRLSAGWARFGSLGSPTLVTTINAITTSLERLDGLLVRMNWSAFGTAASLALSPLPTLVQLITAALLEQIPVLSALINKFLEWIGLKEQAGGTPLPGGAPIGGPGGGIGSNAAGGLLGGRGTGTSDSNLAWVSRGEHIMPALAVAQPGVLSFLEALRRSGGNLSQVLNGMGRFALGGMVPRAMPAFAGGGLAGGMSNVTIQFPGLPAIGGLRASSAVVDELHKAAALAQVRSGGRKPSRYS